MFRFRLQAVGCIFLSIAACNAQPTIPLTQAEAAAIGKQVFKNECNEQELCLTSWNNREAFASLGIGHFIWYPSGKPQRFKESFPAFVRFAKQQAPKGLPAWLDDHPTCPWRTQQEFKSALYRPKLNELRDYLNQNRGVQFRFMLQRAEQALPRLEAAVLYQQRTHIKKQISLLMQSAAGRYAVVDYINFKGEGLKLTERYNQQGWGLLQVLTDMQANNKQNAPEAFSRSAARMLTQRVANAKLMGKDESAWLKGWLKRTKTYQTFFVPQIK